MARARTRTTVSSRWLPIVLAIALVGCRQLAGLDDPLADDSGPAGVLGSYRLAREWLFLLDTHLGLQDVRSTTIMGTVDFPTVLSVAVFARAQWRYR